MKHQFISSVAVSALLIIAGAFSYLAMQKSWDFEIASYSVFVFTLFYILILEQVIPLKKEWKISKKVIWTDLKHFIFSVVIFDALGKTLALSLVLYIQETIFMVSGFWNSLPFVGVYVIANVIGEFLPYWYHRVSHKGNPNSSISLLLWKIHSIHHLPTKLNWFKTNWIHPVNMFLNTILKMIPLLLLGFSEHIIFLVGVTQIVVPYISHANIRTQKSFWDYLIVTPQLHHFHHSIEKEEAKNFGNVLPFWDLVFGTYYNRKGAVQEVGLMEKNKTNPPKNTDFLKQVYYPFSDYWACCR